MAEESTQPEAGTEAKQKGGSKRLIIVGAVVLLLGGGGGAAWYLGFLGGGQAEAKAARAGAEQAEDLPEIGALEALEPFIANLSDEAGRRYLKATLQVEFFRGTVPEEFQQRLPQVRDILLTLFSSKTFAEVRTPQGKAILRDEIVTRLNHVVNRDLVKAIYFTEFIVQ